MITFLLLDRNAISWLHDQVDATGFQSPSEWLRIKLQSQAKRVITKKAPKNGGSWTSLLAYMNLIFFALLMAVLCTNIFYFVFFCERWTERISFVIDERDLCNCDSEHCSFCTTPLKWNLYRPSREITMSERKCVCVLPDSQLTHTGPGAPPPFTHTATHIHDPTPSINN